ncbi:MAG: hypothetical protein M1434_10475 [Chloroflexi bacterium]|nr:hypothetical protein [Chloroflexota bacterium]MCL5275151.1 hypothetical protein [Chloroflexota bacterium]
MAIVIPEPAVALVENPYADLIVAGLRPVGVVLVFGFAQEWQRAVSGAAGPGQTGRPCSALTS